MDEQEEIEDEQHMAMTNAHHTYSIYEPHYQQMHPLIYFDDSGQHQHQHHLQHNSHIMNTAGHPVSHHWDQEHYIHMPLMIPYGDSSSRNCLSANDVSLSHELSGTPENEVIVTTTSSELDVNSPTLTHHCDHETRSNLVVKVEDQKEQYEQKRQQQEENCKDGPLMLESSQNRDRQDPIELECAIDINHLDQIQRGTNSPLPTNRELHNEIERRRRSRIKHCCEVLRTLVPGLSEKTDKATVLEHTVKFVSHLANCPGLKCNCEI